MEKEHLYIAVHCHKYGTSVYAVYSNHFPSTEEVVKLWNIDFEPEKDEFIDITRAGQLRRLE